MNAPSNQDSAAPAPFEVVGRTECLQLVGSQSVGRLAVSVANEPPLVVPINFVLDGEVVVFRSDPGSKLLAISEKSDVGGRIVKQANLSFQVDSIDPIHRTGWSVLIRGLAYEAEAEEVAHLVLEAWAPGDKEHWIRLVPTLITGRRISRPEVAWDTRGYL